MKKTIWFAILIMSLLQFHVAISQSVPTGINYQAVARDSNGNEVVSQALTVKLAIKSYYSGSYTTQWEETHSVITNTYGLFTLVIGKGTTTGGGTQSSFSNIPWSAYDMYLNVSIDIGNGYVDLGKTQLVSVPYALVAGEVAGGTTSSGWLLTGNSGTSVSSNFIGTIDNIDMLFKTNNTEVMRLQSSGNVSIGSSSDLATLLVEADSSDALRVRVDGLTKFIVDEDGNVGVGTLSPSAMFHVAADDNFVVLENGNVGIGTTSPTAALHVGSGNVGIGVGNPTATLMLNSGSSENPFRVQVNSSTKLWVLSNGGTAIGSLEENVPDNGMYVHGQLLIGLDDQSSYYLSNANVIAYENNTTGGAVYGLRGRITGNSSYDENIAVSGYATGDGFHYGVKGVGGSTTGGAYGVYGSASGWVAAVYADGDLMYTGSFSSISDIKFKKNILPMESTLDKIMKLQPKTYEFKTDEYNYMNLAGGKQYGLISQELEKVFPTLIEESMHPGPEDEKGNHRNPVSYKGVKYIEFIPILIEAMQEQQNIINAQQAKIDELDQKVKELSAK